MPPTKTRTTRTDVVAAARKVTTKTKAKAPVLGDYPATLGIIHHAMNSAARKAVYANDRLGLPTPGAKDGKIVWRQPPKKHSGSAARHDPRPARRRKRNPDPA